MITLFENSEGVPAKPPSAIVPTLIAFRFDHLPRVILSFDRGLYISEPCLRRMCVDAGAGFCIKARSFRSALISFDRRPRDHENIRDSRVLLLRQSVEASGVIDPIPIAEDGVKIRMRDHRWFVRSDAVRYFATMCGITDETRFTHLALGSLKQAKAILSRQGAGERTLARIG